MYKVTHDEVRLLHTCIKILGEENSKDGVWCPGSVKLEILCRNIIKYAHVYR
jgi:hypothetical protein